MNEQLQSKFDTLNELIAQAEGAFERQFSRGGIVAFIYEGEERELSFRKLSSGWAFVFRPSAPDGFSGGEWNPVAKGSIGIRIAIIDKLYTLWQACGEQDRALSVELDRAIETASEFVRRVNA